MFCCVVDSAVAAMPSFNDMEKILNASGIVDDVFTDDAVIDNTAACVSGMSGCC